MMDEGIQEGVFPSAALAVGVKDKVLVHKTWGDTGEEKHPQPVTDQTLYDMASLSKVIGTSMAAFKLIENGKLWLSDTVGTFFEAPEDKRNITVFQLMTHTSGITPHFFLSRYASGPSDATRAILNYPLASKPGSDTQYSCMGYILLGKILEKIYGGPLDELVQKYVFHPLGMDHTTYHPAGPCVSTERDPRTGKCLCGVVHDENARFLDGVSGNAGIFSTLNDMQRLASMLACGGKSGPDVFLTKPMLSLAVKNHTKGFSQNRGLGFKLRGGQSEFMGNLFSDKSFGHTGFTGTSLAVDPESGLFAVLLTNRVHPTRENNKLTRFRNVLHNCIAAEYASMNDA